MTIHVRYLSQVIVRMGFEGSYDNKMEKELERCLKEQFDNTKKPLFYIIDITAYEPNEAEGVANQVANMLATKGKIILNIAFLFKKKKKIKNKEIKNKIKLFDNDFQAQSWISDQSRFGFLDEITLESLVKK
ncbi:MAG: hypothetical protein KAU62_09850 [Candidatus Heimdallarchaeota archaeon]|nr:hypothetical protein [Candidatus Heimdallarchaeota archaeon]MCG3256379.1 hypothetical protein [Candidatus Heimdallarchaeota archaeon]MCK4611445.1 hypothetical protein [Candidatus Heimdallarchaeota archaeon]